MKTGYIEGYYGKLLSWKGRSILLKKLSQLKMDFYIYGPKEDPLHRIKWSDSYEKSSLKKFKQFRDEAVELGIKPYFSLSPGIGFTGSQDDIKNIKRKFDQLLELGYEHFALLFDDLDVERSYELATVHGKVLETISQYLEGKTASPLMFCPTVYCNSFARGDLTNSVYIKGLSDSVPESLPLLWTGRDVVSESISNEDILELKALILNPIIIWDNYYANDYCPYKFFIGTFSDRVFTEESVQGLGINPTGMPLTDSIILEQVKGERDTKEILKDYAVPEAFNELLPYFEGPFVKAGKIDSMKDIDNLLMHKQDLCIYWKSDLQLEWAPFLWSFFNDLKLLKGLNPEGDKNLLEAWASRRYSNPLSRSIFLEKNIGER